MNYETINELTELYMELYNEGRFGDRRSAMLLVRGIIEDTLNISNGRTTIEEIRTEIQTEA